MSTLWNHVRKPSRRFAGLALLLGLLAALSGPAKLNAQDKSRTTALPADLQLVPADAAGFLHIRAADLWKSDALADLRQLIAMAGHAAGQAFEKRFIPPPSTVDRITLIWPTVQSLHDSFPQADPEAMSALVVVSLVKPYDQAQLLKSLMPAARPKKYQGKTYYFDENIWRGLYLADDRTFVVGSEDAVAYLFDQLAQKKVGGRLQPALQEAAGKHHVILGLNPGAVPPEAAQTIPPPLLPLLKTQVVLATVDLGKELRLDLQLRFTGADQATEGEKAARAGVALICHGLNQGMQQLEKQLVKDPKSSAGGLQDLPEAAVALLGLGSLRQMEAELKKLPIQRQGSIVRLPVAVAVGPSNSPAMMVAAATTAISTLGRNAEGTFSFVAEKVSSDGSGTSKALEDNLAKLAAAFEKYHAAHGHYPPPAIYSKDGQPLLSWRVALLPYLGEEALYKQFKLDEPWDSLHNKRLLKKMPKLLQDPYRWRAVSAWKTRDQVFTGSGTVFEGAKGVRKADIVDGANKTILLVHVPDEQSVYWTKPLDLAYAADKPLPQLAEKYAFQFHVVLADGTVRSLRKDIGEKTLRALITRNGGEKVAVPD
jgi:hypothetical protein